ncbi:MAG: hypothetical protein P4L55_20260 [Syntrophobacteraceae bacterium]|nr:hypothetical protein [Syntrophobacteraceae bacterium]
MNFKIGGPEPVLLSSLTPAKPAVMDSLIFYGEDAACRRQFPRTFILELV